MEQAERLADPGRIQTPLKHKDRSTGKGLDEGQWQIYLLFYKRQGCYGNRLDDRFSKAIRAIFNPKTGKLTTGWVNCSKGRKRYFTKGGGIMELARSPTAKGRNVIFTKLPVIWQPNG